MCHGTFIDNEFLVVLVPVLMSSVVKLLVEILPIVPTVREPAIVTQRAPVVVLNCTVSSN